MAKKKRQILWLGSEVRRPRKTVVSNNDSDDDDDDDDDDDSSDDQSISMPFYC